MVDPVLLGDNDWEFEQKDLLQRHGIEQTLATAVRTIRAPGCIALYGAWGTGKSTLLRRAYEAHERAYAGCTLWFDPWEYERREDLLSPMIHALVQRMRHKNKAGRVWRLAKGIARTLAALAVRKGAKELLDVELEIETAKSLDLEALEKQFDDWSRYQDELVTLKKDFKQLIELALEGKPDAFFVFFLDDLDRCLPDSVVSVLESVKLLLCGSKGCRAVFVFALDRHVVGDAVAGRYPTASAYSGETYLEKIFDLSLEVPPVAKAGVKNLLDAQWLGMVGNEVTARFECLGGFDRLSEVLQAPAFANPRVIKRVVNRLVLLLRDQDTRTWVTGMNTAQRKRLLVWVAGAERFRSFRHALMTSAEDELLQLFDAARTERPFVGSHLLARVAGLPDFVWYLKELGLLQQDKTTLARERNPQQPGTLRALDDRLRAVGL